MNVEAIIVAQTINDAHNSLAMELDGFETTRIVTPRSVNSIRGWSPQGPVIVFVEDEEVWNEVFSVVACCLAVSRHRVTVYRKSDDHV